MIFIASDHAGFELKEKLKLWIATADLQGAKGPTRERKLFDLGCDSATSVDYPDFAKKLASELLCFTPKDTATSTANTGLLENWGILICGSGQGMCMQANRYPHIRAALVYDEEVAKLARAHNDANVICLGAKKVSFEQAQRWLRVFSETAFEGQRHLNRVKKLSQPI